MDPALSRLFLTLDEFATVSDTLVSLERRPENVEQVTELLEKSQVLREQLARVSAEAVGCRMPEGADGLALVKLLRSFHERIEKGDKVREDIQSFRDTVNNFGEAFAMHVIANLPAIADWPSVARLRGAFRGKPAVIVSAGPSLDRNIEVLRQFKGKALIIAVSHALGALERAGIVPDLAIAIDPADLRHHFAGSSAAMCEAVVLGTSIDPRLFDLPAKRFLTLGANHTLDTWAYEGIEELLPVGGGSVATSAFVLLERWGCSAIILCGQDLSFPDGKYYASATCDGDTTFELSADGQQGRMIGVGEGTRTALGPNSVQHVRRVPGYHGGEVVTDFAFHHAWKWFVDAAAAINALPEPRVALLNCTEGGARIEGMEHVPLAEAAARFAVEEVPVAEILDRAIATVDRDARRQHVLARVQGMRVAAARCVSLTAECKSLAQRAKRRPELTAKLGKAEAKLTRELERLSFVDVAYQQEIRAALATPPGPPSPTPALDRTLRMCAVVEQVLAKTRPLLATAETLLAQRRSAPTLTGAVDAAKALTSSAA